MTPEIILNVSKFLQRIFCLSKTNQVENSRRLQTSNVWRQNISCLHLITTCYFLMCTRLDATDGNMWYHIALRLPQMAVSMISKLSC